MAANNDGDGDAAVLLSMGFDANQALEALSACGNVERAIDFLLGGSQARAVPATAPSPSAPPRAVYAALSQYSDSLGRSACTSIALTLAFHFLNAMATTDDADAARVVDAAFLGCAVREGVRLHDSLGGARGPEHAAVDEILTLCSSAAESDATAARLAASLVPIAPAPRQGLLAASPNHPQGMASVLAQCRADANPRSYAAATITKPPETVLVLLPPADRDAETAVAMSHVLLDSHPRPGRPAGASALFHPTLAGLVASLDQIFPVTELGNDVPEMMAMMYNSFDVYPFQCPPHRRL